MPYIFGGVYFEPRFPVAYGRYRKRFRPKSLMVAPSTFEGKDRNPIRAHRPLIEDFQSACSS